MVAVEGKVFAKLPFTLDFAEVDPEDYGAPDPADLMDPTPACPPGSPRRPARGGRRVRDGDTVLTAYTGTLPGRRGRRVIPSADEDADFEVTFRIDDEGRLRSAEVSGPFYGATGTVDYTISVDDYGTEKDITRP